MLQQIVPIGTIGANLIIYLSIKCWFLFLIKKQFLNFKNVNKTFDWSVVYLEITGLEAKNYYENVSCLFSPWHWMKVSLEIFSLSNKKKIAQCHWTDIQQTKNDHSTDVNMDGRRIEFAN